MLLFSLIAREFRQTARKKRMHGLRLLFGGAIAVWFAAVAFWNLMQGTEAPGHAVYNAIVWPLGFGLAVLAPALAAPSIATERSEQTLGLLFHTHLRPMHIVLAKFTARLVELLWFVVLVLPFLVLPMWMGGVGYDEIIGDSLVLLSILVFGVAVGLCASAFFRSTTLAFIVALGFLVALDFLLASETRFSPILGLGGLMLGFDVMLFQGGSWMTAMGTALNWILEGTKNLLWAAASSILLLFLTTWRLSAISRFGVSIDAYELGSRVPRIIRLCNRTFFLASPLWIFVMSHPVYLGSYQMGYLNLYCIYLACLIIAIRFSFLISRERSSGSLESLACTPLTNASILWPRIWAAVKDLWGLCIFLYFPQLYISSDVFPDSHYLVWDVCFIVLPFFAAAVGGLFSALLQSPAQSIPAASATMLATFALLYLSDLHDSHGWVNRHKWQVIVLPYLTFSLATLWLLIRYLRRFAARE